MAVREGEDRRVGGGPEKLLTLEEAARRLDISRDDLEGMIHSGKLTAFRLGGDLLRVKLQDVEAVRAAQWHALPPRMPAPVSSPKPAPMTEEIPPVPTSAWARISDFFYFNDFYLVAFLIILTLLVVIITF